MNISDIRRDNAQQLANSIGGVVAMSERLGKSQPQVSHLIGQKAHKNIGNLIARQIESAFNKDSGWLDVQHKINGAFAIDDFLSIPLGLMFDDNFCSFVNSLNKLEHEKVFIKLDFKVSHKSFAVLVDDESCGDFAGKDDYLIFDPELKPKHKQYVLVEFGSQIPTVMQYIVMADKLFLEDLTKRFPPIEITKTLDYKFHGVAVYKGHKGERLK